MVPRSHLLHFQEPCERVHCHIGGLKYGVVGVFTPQRLANNTVQRPWSHLPPGESAMHLPAPGWMLGSLANTFCTRVSSLWSTSDFSYGCGSWFHGTKIASHISCPLCLSFFLNQGLPQSSPCSFIGQPGGMGESVLPRATSVDGEAGCLRHSAFEERKNSAAHLFDCSVGPK